MSKVGDRLVSSAKQALAIAKGEMEPAGVYHVPAGPPQFISAGGARSLIGVNGDVRTLSRFEILVLCCATIWDSKKANHGKGMTYLHVKEIAAEHGDGINTAMLFKALKSLSDDKLLDVSEKVGRDAKVYALTSRGRLALAAAVVVDRIVKAK